MNLDLPKKILIILILILASALFLIVFLIPPIIAHFLPGWGSIVSYLIALVLVIPPTVILTNELITNNFIRPLAEISKITHALSTGNLQDRLKTNYPGYLGVISQDINTIINNLLSTLNNMIESNKRTKIKEQELASNIEKLEQAEQFAYQTLDQLKLEKDTLQKNSARDEAILTSIKDGVVAVGRDKKIFLINNAALRMTGRALLETVGTPYGDVLHIATDKEFLQTAQIINLIMDGQEPKLPNNLFAMRKDGKSTPIDLNISPIKSETGEISGVVFVFKDVTEERRLELMKNEFVSVASHELRTPMTAIKGMMSMVLDGDYGELHEDLKEPLTDIYTSTNRLIELVNDMLDVSRMEAGKLQLTLADFKLSEITHELKLMYTPVCQEKGLVLNMENLSDISLQADVNKVKQILSNLIGNSLKFTKQGSITITSARFGDLLRLYITDTGMGIAEADKDKLFGKFQQITTQLDGKPQGTGLGLFISKQLASTMGGDLWIERTRINEGSTFAFSIPISGTQTALKVKAFMAGHSRPKIVQ